MHSERKIDAMLREATANILRIEQNLRDEYTKLIRISPDFNDIVTEIVILERQALSPSEKHEETSMIAERLRQRLDITFGPERNSEIIWDAAMDVMKENSSSATMSYN